MNIVYFHGFGSYFDRNNSKVKALSKIGTVFGYSISYRETGPDTIHEAVLYCLANKTDLVVGCSMGGWLASHVAERLGLPFVALNPAIKPAESLAKYADVPDGEVDHGGYPLQSIPVEVIESYKPICRTGFGLILLETGDELFDYSVTKSYLDKYFDTRVTEGGSHRFDSLKSHLPAIQEFVEQSRLIYGAEF